MLAAGACRSQAVVVLLGLGSHNLPSSEVADLGMATQLVVLLLHPAARTRVGIGPVFASGRFMDYFYRVEGEYVRPDRRGYDASGGYLGTRLQASYRRPVTDRISVVAGGRVENFSGATNAGSPLFRREWNGAVFGGVSISLYRSAETVGSAAEPFD